MEKLQAKYKGRRQRKADTISSIMGAKPNVSGLATSSYGIMRHGETKANTRTNISTSITSEKANISGLVTSSDGRRHGETPTVSSVVEPNTWTTEYVTRQVNARTTSSVADTEPNTWTTEYVTRQVNARTTSSIVDTKSNIWTTESESRKLDARIDVSMGATTSIMGEKASVSGLATSSYGRRKSNAFTTSSIVSVDSIASSTEYVWSKANAHTTSSIVSTELIASSTDYVWKKANDRTTSSIVSASSSTSPIDERRKTNARSTTSSIVSANSSTSPIEEWRKMNAHSTTTSIVSANSSTSPIEEWRKINARSTTSSIVSANSSTSPIEEWRKINARSTTSSIVSANSSTSPIEERRKRNARATSSILSANSSISSTEYERRKANARTTPSIVSAVSSTSPIEERRKVNAHTTSSIVSTNSSIPSTECERRKGNALTTSSILRADSSTSTTEYETAAAVPLSIDPITLTIEEKLHVLLDGYYSTKLVVEGTLSLQVINQEDGFIPVQVESGGGNPGIIFGTHPKINKELFFNESILCLKEPNKHFPSGAGKSSDTEGVVLLNWRLESDDKSILPLRIYSWSVDLDDETYVCIEYEASSTFDLQNVIISVKLPALRKAPQVWLSDGEWRYNSSLEWFIPLIDDYNRGGSLHFFIPPVDKSGFFTISVQFTSANTFCGLKVTNVLPLGDRPPPKFAQRTQLITQSYQTTVSFDLTNLQSKSL